MSRAISPIRKYKNFSMGGVFNTKVPKGSNVVLTINLQYTAQFSEQQ